MSTGDRLSTGVAGLDDVLLGGLPRRRVYLLQGDPGAGKTTLCLQFLLDGAARGERVLYVSLSETREELEAAAASHGWSLDALSILEVSTDRSGDETETTLYHPSEVELGERVRALLGEIDRLRPSRIALDSCSELRLLAESPLRYGARSSRSSSASWRSTAPSSSSTTRTRRLRTCSCRASSTG